MTGLLGNSGWMSVVLEAAWAGVLSLACVVVAAGDLVRVGGTGSASGALVALAKAYERRHPDQAIRVLPSLGSAGGIRAVIDQKLDLGCTSRGLTPDEQIAGLVTVPLADTAFVFATHPSTVTESLSLKEVEDIYGGRRQTWKDGRPIRLVLRPKSDTAHAYLSGFTPGMSASLERAHAVPGVSVGITDQEALDRLEQTPGSFGTTVLGLVLAERRHVQVLPVNGVPPSDPNYPFFISLTLVHRPGTSSAAIRGFLEFIRSNEGRQILLSTGYRPSAAGPPGRPN